MQCLTLGLGLWNGGTEKIKSIFGNLKNAAKFKNPSDNIVKAIWGIFFCSDSNTGWERGIHSELKHGMQNNENAKSQNVSFKIISHLNQNFLTCQRKTPSEPEMLLESTWELVPFLHSFQEILGAKMEGQKSQPDQWMRFLVHDLGHPDEKEIPPSFHGRNVALDGSTLTFFFLVQLIPLSSGGSKTSTSCTTQATDSSSYSTAREYKWSLIAQTPKSGFVAY